MKNTGDDALQAVTCWGVKKYLHADQLHITSTTSLEFPDLGIVNPIYSPSPFFRGENRLRGYMKSINSDGVVFGGGSVFHSSSYLRMANHFIKLAGKGPHAAVGVSIGPFRNITDEKDCAKLLNKFYFIGLRDLESYEITKALAPQVQSELTFDLAPLLQLAANSNNICSNNISNRKGIGISLCDFEHFVGGNVIRDSIRRKKLAGLLEKLVADTDEELVFIDFNGHNYFGDHQLHKELAEIIGGQASIRHLHYNPNPLYALSEISKLKVIVAMRLHASIFGYMVNTPTIMLSYHPKCLGWANQIGMDKALVFDSVDFDVAEVVNSIQKSILGNFAAPTLSLNESIENSMKNWSWAGKI